MPGSKSKGSLVSVNQQSSPNSPSLEQELQNTIWDLRASNKKLINENVKTVLQMAGFAKFSLALIENHRSEMEPIHSIIAEL